MSFEENIRTEIAKIASLSIRLRKFADTFAVSFAFFIYASGITGFVIIGKELSSLLNGLNSVIVWVSNIVGIVFSTIIVIYVYSFLFRYVGIRTDAGKTIRALLAGLTFGTVVIIIYELILHIIGIESFICWYPWFGGYMIGLGIYPRERREPSMQYILIAGVLIILTSPIAILNHELLLIGLIDVIFTVTGFFALRELTQQLSQ